MGSSVYSAAPGARYSHIRPVKTPMCGEPGGKTSPEELAAAAHSACFSMALALRLAEHGHDSERLTVASTVTLDEVDGAPTVVSSELEVSARVLGLDRDGFDAAVEEAAQLCPISRLFAGAQITVQANLEQN